MGIVKFKSTKVDSEVIPYLNNVSLYLTYAVSSAKSIKNDTPSSFVYYSDIGALTNKIQTFKNECHGIIGKINSKKLKLNNIENFTTNDTTQMLYLAAQIELNPKQRNKILSEQDSTEVVNKYLKFDGAIDRLKSGDIEEWKRVGASVVNGFISVIDSGAELVEDIVDFGVLVFTGVETIYTGMADIEKGIFTGDWSWESTESLWDNTKAFVSQEWVSDVKDHFYKDTELGRNLDKDAYAPFKSDGAGCNFINGLGRVAGIVAITTLTGGTAPLALAGTAAVAGTGKYTSEEFNKNSVTISTSEGDYKIAMNYQQYKTVENLLAGQSINIEQQVFDENKNPMTLIFTIGKDSNGNITAKTQYGDSYNVSSLNESSTVKSLAKGAIKGAWEGTQYYVGGKVNSLNIYGTGAEISSREMVFNSMARVALDGVTGAPEIAFQSSVDAAFDENLSFNEAWKQNGGWEATRTNTLLAMAASTFGEVKQSRSASKTNINAQKNSSNKITLDNEMTYDDALKIREEADQQLIKYRNLYNEQQKLINDYNTAGKSKSSYKDLETQINKNNIELQKISNGVEDMSVRVQKADKVINTHELALAEEFAKNNAISNNLETKTMPDTSLNKKFEYHKNKANELLSESKVLSDEKFKLEKKLYLDSNTDLKTKQSIMGDMRKTYLNKNLGIDLENIPEEILTTEIVHKNIKANESDARMMREVSIEDIIGSTSPRGDTYLEEFLEDGMHRYGTNSMQYMNVNILDNYNTKMSKQLSEDGFELNKPLSPQDFGPHIQLLEENGKYFVSSDGNHTVTCLKLSYLDEMSKATTEAEKMAIRNKYTVVCEVENVKVTGKEALESDLLKANYYNKNFDNYKIHVDSLDDINLEYLELVEHPKNTFFMYDWKKYSYDEMYSMVQKNNGIVSETPIKQFDVPNNVSSLSDISVKNEEFNSIFINGSQESPKSTMAKSRNQRVTLSDDYIQLTKEVNAKGYDLESFAALQKSTGLQTEEAILEASKLATKKYSLAVQAEPKITNAMHNLEDETKKLVGLDFRLKKEKSLTRKILTDAEHNVTKANRDAILLSDLSTACDDIGDSIRYTLICDEKTYTSDIIKSLQKLKDDGYTVLKFKNTWDNPIYKGINTSIISPDGVRFELQFHTKNSYSIKEETNHIFYEIARNECCKELSPKAIEYSSSIMATVGLELQGPEGIFDLKANSFVDY